MNNRSCLNILRPRALRQYFGWNITENLGHNSPDSSGNETIFTRYSYGSGSVTALVDMDPYNFVTHKTSDTLECMADELHCVIKSNKTLLNMNGVNMSKKINHCSVILYYTRVNLKKNFSLGSRSDCIYSPINGKFVTNSNFQMENTPAVIYSTGTSRNLYWKRRKIG